jgi:hypothetical protein
MRKENILNFKAYATVRRPFYYIGENLSRITGSGPFATGSVTLVRIGEEGNTSLTGSPLMTYARFLVICGLIGALPKHHRGTKRQRGVDARSDEQI